MKRNIWIVILITSVLFINCGEKEIKDINLQNPIFKASGNNPNWKIEIGENGDIHFYSNSELDKIITPSSEMVEIMDIAATSYHSTTESEEIKVEIFRKQCINSKSSRETKYEVRIEAKQSNDKEYKIFKGCGEFFADKIISG